MRIDLFHAIIFILLYIGIRHQSVSATINFADELMKAPRAARLEMGGHMRYGIDNIPSPTGNFFITQFCHTEMRALRFCFPSHYGILSHGTFTDVATPHYAIFLKYSPQFATRYDGARQAALLRRFSHEYLSLHRLLADSFDFRFSRRRVLMNILLRACRRWSHRKCHGLAALRF